MIVVRLKPRDFAIPLHYLHALAEEHHGRMLHEEDATPGDTPWAASSFGDANQEPWEFGFEDVDGMSARSLAVAFATALGSFKRPASGDASIDPSIDPSI